MNTFDKINEYIVPSYGRYEIALESGNSFSAIDESGKKYIDFGSGIGVNSLGFCDPEWVEAVCNQVKTLQHVSNYFYNKTNADLAEKLCNVTGYKKVFFGNSGAEANESAIKAARKYSFDKYGGGRDKIIVLKNSFHGRTMATISATGQSQYHNYFFPFLEGFIFAEVNNIEDLENKLDDSVCAIMFEYIQGEGGIVSLEKDFTDKIFSLAEEQDLITIADEVQTGVGRTGKFLAGEYYGKTADITTLAKGLGSGLPIGAALMDEKCMNVLSKGTHGSTFGGNPVSSAGGIIVVDRVSDPDFLAEVREKGEYIREKLNQLDEVKEISGKGLMIGISLKTKDNAWVLEKGLEKGLLTLTAKEKLRLLPPLSISWEELETGVEILTEIFR